MNSAPELRAQSLQTGSWSHLGSVRSPLCGARGPGPHRLMKHTAPVSSESCTHPQPSLLLPAQQHGQAQAQAYGTYYSPQMPARRKVEPSCVLALEGHGGHPQLPQRKHRVNLQPSFPNHTIRSHEIIFYRFDCCQTREGGRTSDPLREG